MKRVRVTNDADRDLDQIWLYIAQDNVDAANQLIDELISRFPLLGSLPRIGRSREELKPNLRSHAVGNYVIYYRERSEVFPFYGSSMAPETQSEH